MKKCTIFAATLLLLVMVSCNQEIQNPAELFSVVKENTRAEKNPLDEIDFSALDTVFFVADKDVEAYLYFKELLAKGRGQEFVIRDIIPMGLNNEVTLAYLLVYGQGWEIIAADKRAPVVLGGDPIMTLPSKELPSEITAWIETLEYDVLYLRSFNGRPDVADDETWDKMLGSIDFWRSVNAETEYVEKKTNTTRVAPDDNPKYIPPGHWELESTDEYTEVLESVGPLVTVNFHQNAPFNNCCPYAYPYTTGRAVAGCTAVAGAQMAHYLHFYIGRPLLAPTNGYCNTNAYKLENGIYVKDHEAYLGINVSYSDQSSTIWSSMANYSSLASYLIADIGKRIFTDYGYDSSGATIADLVAWYFIDNGVMCRDSTYDSGIVTASICDDMPVILGASTNVNGQSVGHTFIADGWRKCRIRTENTYVWVWDEPTNIMPPASINTVITYGPIFQQLHMNWGWGAQYNGDTSWYAPTGNWIPDGRNFNLSRSMVWGFELFDE